METKVDGTWNLSGYCLSTAFFRYGRFDLEFLQPESCTLLPSVSTYANTKSSLFPFCPLVVSRSFESSLLMPEHGIQKGEL